MPSDNSRQAARRPGLVIVNPPYGDRIGDTRQLYGLYGAFGETMLNRFKRWRVGVITNEVALAQVKTFDVRARAPRST